jgi:hypothetical protein
LAQLAAESPRAYARGYEMRALTDDEMLFPTWKRVREQYAGETVLSVLGEARKDWFGEYDRWGGVDLASDSRPGNVIVTIAVARDKNTHPQKCIVSVVRKQCTHPQLLQHMTYEMKAWGWTGVVVETNAQQGEFLHWGEQMAAPWAGIVKGHVTTAKKWDSIVGLPGIEVELSQGKWAFPAGEMQGHAGTCECGWCTLDKEMSGFTLQGPSSGSKGDCVMALYLAWTGAREGDLSRADFTVVPFRR